MIEIRNTKVEDKELQTRADKNEAGQKVIIGYASLFDHVSKPITERISINGGVPTVQTYFETIDKRAFDSAHMEDVVYLIDHDPSQLIARKSAGNLELMVTDKGLMYKATLPDTTIARDLSTNVEVGNYQENSFAFRVKEDSWQRVDGALTRRILSIEKVADVSTVISGAYSDTVLATRTLTIDEPLTETNVNDGEIEKDALEFEILYKSSSI